MNVYDLIKLLLRVIYLHGFHCPLVSLGWGGSSGSKNNVLAILGENKKTETSTQLKIIKARVGNLQ